MSTKFMSKKTMQTKTIQIARISTLFLLVLSACTKDRPAALPDGADENVLEKSLFTGTEATVKTTGALSGATANETWLANKELPRVGLASVQAPEKIRPMFKDLVIQSPENQEVKIRFGIDPSFVTAYKVLTTASGLSSQENEIAKTVDGQTWVPLFQYPVQAAGQLIRAKNDLGEETSTLRFKSTNWDEATHIQLSTLVAQRTSVEIPVDATESASKVFVKGKLDGQVVTQSEINSRLGTNISWNSEATFLTQLDSENLNLLEVVSIDSPMLSSRELEIIAGQDKGQARATEIARCTSEQLAKIQARINIAADKCLLVLRVKVPASNVVARRKAVDQAGTLAATINYQTVANSESARLVQVDPAGGYQLITNESVDTTRMISTQKLKNKIFLFRRTLVDSPNLFDYTFAGASSKMERVKFKFLNDSVAVVRAEALFQAPGMTSVDQEILMQIPASYKRPVMTDSRGNKIPYARYISADADHPDAVAILDWESDKFPNLTSPLDTFGLEQCFQGKSDRRASGIQAGLTAASFNVTLSTTYVGNPDVGCMEDPNSEAAYWGNIQSTFTFRERISFKEVNDAEQESVMDLPYETQRKLGFGIFTYKSKKPNQYGNTGTFGTEVSLPAIFNLKGGKKITYVLAGIPSESQNPELRKALIQSTQEVVNDWNSAFKKASAGTGLERDDVLELKVEGQDAVEGAMGDLDRNYIYYVQKKTASSVIGLGGSHANPKTGYVEAASVFIYGGNIGSYVESFRKMDANKKAYQARHPELASLTKAPTLAEELGSEEVEDIEGEKEAMEEDLGDEEPESIGASIDGKINSTLKSIRSMDLSQKTLRTASIKNRNEKISKFKKIETVTLANLKSGLKKIQRKPKTSLTRLADLMDQPGIKKLAETSPEAVAIRLAVEKSIANRTLTKPKHLEALFNEALLESKKGRASPQQIAGLNFQAKKSARVAKIMDRLEHAGYCLYEANESAEALGKLDVAKATDIELQIAVYKPTLAHEIGHNLGLRHNFIASYDKKNWKHSHDDKSTRDYSSIMDYLDTDHETYDGMGPQDVHAIRAAYAGLLEVKPEVIEPVKQLVSVVGDRFIAIKDLKTIARIKSWQELTQDFANQVLKTYKFCSDEDAGEYPTCNRFDKGSTPLEIVHNISEGYRALYTLTNFANDKINFTNDSDGQYIGRLFGQLLTVRQFVEETFVQMGSVEAEEFWSYVGSILSGNSLLTEILTTPMAGGHHDMNSRIATLKLSENVNLNIERKFSGDIRLDDTSRRLFARGVEYDKLIALIALTERSFGFERYESRSIRISYPEFESMLMGGKPEELPSMMLLKNGLANQLKATIPLPTKIKLPGGFTPIIQTTLDLDDNFDNQYSVDSSNSVRFYYLLGAIMNLDVDGMEAKDNLSSTFRIMRNFSGPEGVASVVQPGSNRNSRSNLKYWAADDAAAAQALIDQGLLYETMQSTKTTLSKDIRNWIALRLKLPLSPERRGLKLEALEKKLDEELAKLSEKAGPRDTKTLGSFLEGTFKTAKDLERASTALPPEMMSENVFLLSQQYQNTIKNFPIAGVMLSEMAGELEESGVEAQYFGPISSSSTNDLMQSITWNHTQQLSSFLEMLHPEFGN